MTRKCPACGSLAPACCPRGSIWSCSLRAKIGATLRPQIGFTPIFSSRPTGSFSASIRRIRRACSPADLLPIIPSSATTILMAGIRTATCATSRLRHRARSMAAARLWPSPRPSASVSSEGFTPTPWTFTSHRPRQGRRFATPSTAPSRLEPAALFIRGRCG